MNKLHIPNEFVEWVFIIVGVTIAGLVGAGLKTWLDSALDGSGVEGWAPGVVALSWPFSSSPHRSTSGSIGARERAASRRPNRF